MNGGKQIIGELLSSINDFYAAAGTLEECWKGGESEEVVSSLRDFCLELKAGLGFPEETKNEPEGLQEIFI